MSNEIITRLVNNFFWKENKNGEKQEKAVILRIGNHYPFINKENFGKSFGMKDFLKEQEQKLTLSPDLLKKGAKKLNQPSDLLRKGSKKLTLDPNLFKKTRRGL